ncbi:hypothetical protein IEQ34_010307 [Dendrobium chrysotoxum]|uniref:Uncharacterized protein n=1 Tax=Dendrobium chrysotoxum TaxID=161865 RepID=A0AAV7H1I6_DENCH|nr:hypothetical protein IEQ34_010307 [Dendrobium chrysotoxum]
MRFLMFHEPWPGWCRIGNEYFNGGKRRNKIHQTNTDITRIKSEKERRKQKEKLYNISFTTNSTKLFKFSEKLPPGNRAFSVLSLISTTLFLIFFPSSPFKIAFMALTNASLVIPESRFVPTPHIESTALAIILCSAKIGLHNITTSDIMLSCIEFHPQCVTKTPTAGFKVGQSGEDDGGSSGEAMNHAMDVESKFRVSIAKDDAFWKITNPHGGQARNEVKEFVSMSRHDCNQIECL